MELDNCTDLLDLTLGDYDSTLEQPLTDFKCITKVVPMFWHVMYFLAPEKVTSENVGVAADVWGIGVLTFIL